jgi:hypothetical protein
MYVVFLKLKVFLVLFLYKENIPKLQLIVVQNPSALKVPKYEIFGPIFFKLINPFWVDVLWTGTKN